MNGSFFAQVFSLIYIFVLLIIYLSKERINLLENKIFKYIMISNIIGLMIEITCFLLGYFNSPYDTFNMIMVRLYLTYLFTFVSLFTFYIFVISREDSKNITSGEKKSLISKLLIVYLIIIFLVFILPINLINNGSLYADGAGVILLYVVISCYLFIWFVLLIKNFKNIRDKRYAPVFMFILFGSVVMVIQNIYPELLLMTAMESFIVFLMYHTIENPDVNLLREIANQKKFTDRMSQEKSLFLFNMSQDIKKPVMDIQKKCEVTLMSDSETDLKDGVRSIKESANQVSRLINASLNINDANSNNLRLVDKRYNSNLLFKQLIEMTKSKLKDKPNIDFRYKIDEAIPTYLMGDAIRFKQIISIMLNNAIKHTDSGYIEFDVLHVIKRDICSFIIHIEDSGSGMSQEKLDQVLNSNKEVTGNRDDVPTAKTLAGLSNGTIMGVSEEGKGSKFTIIINQKLAVEEVNTTLKSITSDLSDKKILVVDNEEKDQNRLIKLLSSSNINVDIVNMGVGCLEKIRNGEHYDLIIIDEELPKLSGIMTYQKLKLINNFNTPVILMIDKKHTDLIERYLENGFKKCLVKPIKKIEFENIIDNLNT